MGTQLDERVRRRRTLFRFGVMVAAGIVTGLIIGFAGFPEIAPIGGWSLACVLYLSWIWLTIGRMNAADTQSHATREDPSRPVSDVLLLLASTASLVVIAFVLIASGNADAVKRDTIAILAVVSVALSWFLIHTLYMLRYAVLYYSGGTVGGVNFNQKEPPRYADFAYLAFVLGMTFQVSDTNIESSVIRISVLRHSLLSYLFGAVILGSMVNLIAGFNF